MALGGRRKYLTDYLFGVVAQLVTALRPIIVIPILTRWVSVEAYGVWGQAAVTALFVGGILSFQMPSLLTRYYAGIEEDRTLSAAVTAGLLLPLTTGAAATLIGWVFRDTVSTWAFGEAGFHQVVLPMMLLCTVHSLTVTLFSYFLIVGRQKTQIVIQLIIEFGAVGLVALLASTQDIALIILAGALWRGLVFLAVLLYVLGKHGLARPKLPSTAEFWRFGLWLVLSYAALFWATRGSRYLLVGYLGIKTGAIFGIIYALASLVRWINMPNNLALRPLVIAHWNAGSRDEARALVRLAYKVLFLMGMLLLGGYYLYGNTVVRLLSGKHTAVPGWVFVLMASSELCQGIVIVASTALWIEKRGSVIFIPQLAGVLANVTLCVLLIRPLGLPGAAIAVTCSMAIQAIWLYRASRPVFREGIDWAHTLRALLCGIIMVAALEVYGLARMPVVLHLVSGIILAAAVYAAMALALKVVPVGLVRRALDMIRQRGVTKRPEPEIPVDQPPGADG